MSPLQISQRFFTCFPKHIQVMLKLSEEKIKGTLHQAIWNWRESHSDLILPQAASFLAWAPSVFSVWYGLIKNQICLFMMISSNFSLLI